MIGAAEHTLTIEARVRKRVAIMQPYFFPYVGYFQLMRAVDCIVLYDDAQYSKGGWINRNRLLVGGRAGWWTYPVIRASHRFTIRQRDYCRTEIQTARLLAQVEHAYRRAPQFDRIFPRIEAWLRAPISNVADFNRYHLEALARELGIDCRVVASSELPRDAATGGETRLIELCRGLGATHYLNPIGGRALYDAARFTAAGLTLEFLRPRPMPYAQFDAPHLPSLSIVDILMFNPQDRLPALLAQYDCLDTSSAAYA